ncbi:MAG: hypothetical protein JXA71_08315, partial [Chitinispirillaceae bacterium]|nr:hypothetical protein [Chitinispirillaceae bacterium]
MRIARRLTFLAGATTFAGCAPALLCCLLFSFSLAELPPDLPGEEISHEQLHWMLPRDTAKETLTITPRGTGLAWLDKAQ